MSLGNSEQICGVRRKNLVIARRFNAPRWARSNVDSTCPLDADLQTGLGTFHNTRRFDRPSCTAAIARRPRRGLTRPTHKILGQVPLSPAKQRD